MKSMYTMEDRRQSRRPSNRLTAQQRQDRAVEAGLKTLLITAGLVALIVIVRICCGTGG